MLSHVLPHPQETRPRLDLARDIRLALGRVHEACGPARRSFALWLAGRMQGTVMWIAPAWEREALNPDGMVAFADPSRFLFVTPRRGEDLLWCAEEALRAGAVPLVVVEVPEPPRLTPVRRLHLAADTGAETGGILPLGLLLTPGAGGAQGIETRWHMAGAHEGAARCWRLERRRARALPPAAWQVRQTRAGPDLSLTPAPVLP